MGGYHISNQECKVFSRLPPWGGELEKAESAPIVHVRKEKQRKHALGKKKHQSHHPLPPKISHVIVQLSLLPLFANGGSCRLTPKSPAPAPTFRHVSSRTGGDCRQNHSASSP